MRYPWQRDHQDRGEDWARRSLTAEERRQIDIQRANGQWADAIFSPAIYALTKAPIEEVVDMDYERKR